METSKDYCEERNYENGTAPFTTSTTTHQRMRTQIQQRKEKLVPPDGGWGWFVVFGGFLNATLCTFSVSGFGIIFSPLLTSSNTSSAKIAWIFNIHHLFWSCCALLVGPLIEQFGWRKLTFIGGILNFLSLLLSSFVPSPDFLFITYSFLGGAGGTISLTAALIAVSRYFVKHRGFAIGAASMGACVSSFVSPLISNYLIENYGYVGASWIFGAIVLNQCVGAALLQPLEWHMKPIEADLYEDSPNREETAVNPNETILNQNPDKIRQESQLDVKPKSNNRKLSGFSAYSVESFDHSVVDISSVSNNGASENEQAEKSFFNIVRHILKSTFYNFTLLKYHRMIIIALASGCFTLGYINFQLWIPFVVTNAGYSLEVAAWCVSAASISNVIGRIIISLVSDGKHFNVTYGHMTGIFLMAISVIGFSFAREITVYLIFVCCWGFGTGVAGSSNANNMINVMGVELFPATFGVASLFRGVFSIIFGPLAGVVRDETESYTPALCLLGSLTLFGVVLYLFLPLAAKHDRKRELQEKIQNIEDAFK